MNSKTFAIKVDGGKRGNLQNKIQFTQHTHTKNKEKSRNEERAKPTKFSEFPKIPGRHGI